ncbi:Fic family protein [Bradyrhizobium erythrophlei]|uniref:Fic family protein n=1 Tax=Bradyrhizobium erythrophlei TaxID=1437360 RepID=UPI0035EFEDF8
MATAKSSQQSSHPDLDEADEILLDTLRASENALSAQELSAALTRVGRPVSPATLARRLERLIAERHVLREGRARSTRYRKDPYHDYFSFPPGKRQRVGYNAAALSNYVPNETRWLSEEVRARLEKVGGGRRRDASTYSRSIAQKLLVDLAFASSALEGNTYTYLDTQVLIEFGQAAEGKDRDETVMILNHKEAISYLTQHIADIEILPREFKTFHALLSRGLSNMDPRDVGSIRRMPIDEIGGSAYLPLAKPQRLEEEMERIAKKANKIEDPFERSLFLMVFISYLQAFRDVNKRTARLVCNVPLLKAGVAPLSFMDMDKTSYVKGLLTFYELNRTDLITEAFAEAYEKSAARYDAYAGRPQAVLDIEFRRRNDIFNSVKAYVLAIGNGEQPSSIEDFVRQRFPNDDQETQALLVEMVREIVESLNDGNHIAYGISRQDFAQYEASARAAAPLTP